MASCKTLYAQCNPLLDIAATVDLAFLEKYGLKPASATMMAPQQNGIFEELEANKSITYTPGGAGLNAARVAQWMSQAPKLSFAQYVGCIAEDKHGEILKAAAEKDGVKMILDVSHAHPTGTCAVCVTGKERSLCANLGAANDLSEAHLHSPAVQKAIEASQLFYFTGFTLTLKVEYVLWVAEKCLAQGGLFMLNLSAPFVIQFFGEQLMQVLPYTDVIFSNDDEAKTFATVQGWDTQDVAAIALRVSNMPHKGTHKRTVVFTQGSKPTIYAVNNTVREVAVDKIPHDAIVDTNGAGDAFVGGFLAGMRVGRDVETCIRAGNYAAGVVIQHSGCTYPPTPSFSL